MSNKKVSKLKAEIDELSGYCDGLYRDTQILWNDRDRWKREALECAKEVAKLRNRFGDVEINGYQPQYDMDNLNPPSGGSKVISPEQKRICGTCWHWIETHKTCILLHSFFDKDGFCSKWADRILFAECNEL